MDTQTVTLTFQTDMDPSTLLDLAQAIGFALAQDVRDHGEPCRYNENDVAVTS